MLPECRREICISCAVMYNKVFLLYIKSVKSGGPDESCNYRPISIKPLISKVLEKIVAEQLMNYLERKELLNPK